jgi:hypothetical protein
MSACAPSSCGAAYPVQYGSSDAPIALTLYPMVLTPIDPAPYQVAVAKCASAMVTFAGTITLAALASTTTVNLVLSYYNTALPSIVTQQMVPVVATLAPAVATPISSSLAVSLAPGTYAFNVAFDSEGAVASVGVSGLLNIVVIP